MKLAGLGSVENAHDESIWTAAWAPATGDRSALLLTGSLDETVRVWSSDSLTPVGSPSGGHALGVVAVATHPAGLLAASASLDSFIRVFEIDSNSTIATLEAPPSEVWGMQFDPKGNVLAVAGGGSASVKLWDTSSWQLIASLAIWSGFWSGGEGHENQLLWLELRLVITTSTSAVHQRPPHFRVETLGRREIGVGISIPKRDLIARHAPVAWIYQRKGLVPSLGLRTTSGNSITMEKLPEEMNDMKIKDDKEVEATVIDGNGTETGHIIVTTIGGKNGQPKQTISYMAERVVGHGSFGIVFQAKCLETGETVAIKKVLQDKRYKNRELQTMRILDHPNVVSLKHCFFSTTEKDELYLNLVLEYVPETAHRVIKHYNKMNQRMPMIYVKLYSYQIFRALAYIHDGIGVCHRDIKPQNLLVNPHTHQLKLCDFGSAKVLVKGEPNISYICSRYYRAPELIFGATEYTTAIDIWSAGCVLAELLLGQPLFPGESGVDQLVEIIKVLGTPTREEIKCMNPNYTEFKFPQIKAHPWHKIFPKRTPPEAVDLVSRLLQYSPNLRSTALETLTHPFFDELRDPNTRLPNGRTLPPLFNFKPHELRGVPMETLVKLIPEHARKQYAFLGL
ncbi:hypothetical protein J5N97_018404 [Dioscorea zingiberensis]|uniref:non-specific serine/threonine protein kinase n=1 Tax=Dioscorea zingiberensis TaxID=325984 RepID=A0A9D5CNP9_9LILI|nr:hypothetical protein J5N97_018404 [Dioscorea zingiberensis]